MKVLTFLTLLTWILFSALASPAGADSRDYDSYRIAPQHQGNVLHSSGSLGASKAAADTFYIYGGADTAEGKFQTLPGIPGGAPDWQGWTTHDLTEQTPRWRGSSTNASSVGDGNPKGFTGEVGNNAAISNHEGGDYFGYGNNWDDWLVLTYDLAVADPGFDPETDNTDLRLTCEYKHYSEELYDYLLFEWNQAGVYQLLLAVDGTSYNDSTGYYEKRDFDSDLEGGISYVPGDYIDGTKIQLRIRFTSDGGWSDEDGLFGTGGRGGGAIDNVRVYVNGGVASLADFEPAIPGAVDLPEGDFTDLDVGAGVGTLGWIPTPSTFAGDFAKLFVQFQDLDPCRDNVTPLVGFINDGTSPNNCPGCPVAPSVSPTWGYGIPGGYVVDYNGGLTNGVVAIHNEIWSPEIDWDLDGPEDDVANGGAAIGYTNWLHMPLINGVFSIWHVRSFDGVDWSGWEDNNFVYYSVITAWGNAVIDVTDKLVQSPQKVQIALGVMDLSEIFAFPGTDATPAPLYDNVYFKKFVIGGPVFSSRTIELAGDCFPIDGTKTGSCRFDANIDRNATVLVPGDSIVVEIKAIIPGTALASPTTGGDLVANHLVNPDFAGDRAAGMAVVGGVLIGTDPQTGWEIYAYRVAGQQVTSFTGDILPDRFFWDLPDGLSNGLPHIANEDALFFPGDVVHYYLEASDDLGNTSTLPEDLAGFGDFTEGNLYHRIQVLRMLPTLQGGTQPTVLFWDDVGRTFNDNEYLYAFRQNGMIEGVDYDTYTTKGSSSGVGNGLGSAGYHGANAGQLDGYDCIVYALGILNAMSISDGSGINGNDLGNDLATMENWANADADRYHAYFGDSFSQAMISQGARCQTYLNTVLGVDLLNVDVGPAIDGQTAAVVEPSGLGSGSFVTPFLAYGGCLAINDFDQIGNVGVGPEIAHEFTDVDGFPYLTPVAGSIEWRHTDDNGNTKHSIVFPFDLISVEDIREPGGTGISARARLLGEIFASWGKNLGGPAIGVDDPATPPVRHEFHVEQNHPNPFNPSTRIEFSLPQRGEARVTLYNVRGERVAVLLDEIREAGPSFVDWNGRDDRGAEVSSGIYLYKVEAAGQEAIKKMVLIR